MKHGRDVDISETAYFALLVQALFFNEPLYMNVHPKHVIN